MPVVHDKESARQLADGVIWMFEKVADAWDWFRSKLPSWLGGKPRRRKTGEKPKGKTGKRPKPTKRK
tara:strand:+ start:612 stop:812 length:201 start_codon:yes stop_codon:yes gene_type:complete